MPKGMKRAKDAQRNKTGKGSPKYYKNKPSSSTELHELSKRESARQAQRRPVKHKPKCNMAKAMRWHDRSVSQPTKKTRAGLKKERPMLKQNPTQGENKIQRTKTQ